jgi:hypothetical protein
MGDDLLSENLTGQLIVVESDQGFGDKIYFPRFMAEIRKRGAQTRYIADPRLVPMLTRAAATTDEVIAKGSRYRAMPRQLTHALVTSLMLSD